MSSAAANTPSAQSSTPQQQPTPPTSGTATPQPAPAAAAGRSYASAANKKSFGTLAHGKSDSVNGDRSIAPVVPTLGGPTIINGNAGVSSPVSAHEHARKPSVTISAAGTTGQMPNGGPVAGHTPTGSNLQFGSISNPAHTPGPNMAQQDAASLSVGAPSNPRVVSPSSSPSPIPQPAVASGGRPPSSLHGASNSLSFGQFPAENNERRPSVPSQAGTPNMQNAHLRRESSHNQHSDPNMNAGAGRGGFPQGGRGRGFNNNNFGSTPQSPQPRYNTVPSNVPRGPAQNGPPQYAQRGPGYGQGGFPSPHPPGRSPHLAHAQPVAPHQPGQMPMQSPNMPPGSYYQPTGPPNMQGYNYDPQAAYYGGQNYMQSYMAPQNGYGMGPVPNSPRPQYQAQNAGYAMQGQYAPPQPQPMSRQGSTVSTERPGSTLGQPQTPMTPSAGHQHNPSRGANSPGPKSSAFQIPGKKASSAIKITNPNTGEALSFDKTPASPALATATKAPESAPTPPPRTPSSQHNRSDSKATKTKEEVQNEMRAQIQAKLKADQEKAQKEKDEEESKKRQEQEAVETAAREKAEAEEAARKAEEEKQKADAEHAAREAQEAKLAQEKALEAEKAKAAQLEQAEKKIAEEKARAAEAAPSAQSTQPAAVKNDDDLVEPVMPDADASDDVWDKYDKDLDVWEKAKEAAYSKKKAEKKAAEERLVAEKNARLDEELHKQEAEAERLEAEKEKKRETGESDSGAQAFAALKKSENAFQATRTATEVLPQHGSGTESPSGTETPKSDASSMPPPSRPGQKQKPAALKLETQKQVEAAQPSAALQSLRSARRLAHVNPNLYPEGIQSPNPALNTSAAAKGSFRYDKDFLMQFQKVFTEKPSETWSEKLKETVGDTDNPPQSARGNRQSLGGGRTPSRSGFQPMGNFGGQAGARTLPAGTSSSERFAASSGRAPSGGVLRYDPARGPQPAMGGFVNPGRQLSNNMARGSSHHGSGPRPGGGGGPGSRRGNPGQNKKADSSMPLTAGMDLKPIATTDSGWKPRSIGTTNASGPPPGGENGYLAPDVVQRKVKSALNKMTPTNFEKISTQILDITMQSKKETDGRTLRQVIQLTFEKATDESHWAEMYAQFCGKMLQNMTPDIRDETQKDKNGQIINGSTLFRKYLLNRCQQDFEQGWKSKLPDLPEDNSTGEAAMLSDEYYVAAAAKRRGLGLVRFIGELFKLHMLTARIMHMCVRRLVDFEGMPDEAEVESLTSLLRTIGENLDNFDDKSRAMMNAYFDRIEAMMKTDGLPSRLRFMLLDIIDLRKANWQDKSTKQKGPATIDQIRADAVAAQREAEARAAADQQNRRGGGGRPGAGRGDARNFSGPPPDFQNNRVNTDDLRRLTKGGSTRSSGAQAPMGPTSMFNTARGSNKRTSMAPGGIFARAAGDDSNASSRTGTPPIKNEKPAAGANAFSALAGLDSNEGNDTTSPPPSVAALSPPTEKRSLPDRSKLSGQGREGAGTGA